MKKNQVVLLSMLFICIVFGYFAKTDFSFAETAKELEQNIEDRTDELKNLEAEAKRIQAELSKTGAQKSSLNKELTLINAERKSLENNIAQTRAKINVLDSEIEKTEYQIDVQRNKIIQQSQFLESLLRRTYQQESFSLLENLFSVSSISTLLRQRDTYLTLQNPIYEKTLELKQSRDILFFDKKVLALKQDDLESEKEKFDDQKSIVADQEKKKKTVLKTTQNKENIYQETLAETNRRIAALDKQIREFESKLKFILDKTSIPTKGSGVLNWPLKDIYVTQRFGRTTSSGVLYASGSHSGADFRAAVGTPVYAVADGVVTGAGDTDTACPNISFGKWILIEHDIGLSTTSGHLSKIKVNKGQKVKKGQLIGYSGNTGRSTGPHLHLTVYATHGSDGKKVVEVIKYDSWTCPGKSIVRPSAPTGAYLNPIDYLPPASRNMFKHPRL